MIDICDLYVKFDDVEILKGVSLSIKKGEIHAIMGPNGSGKSTLSKVICGHPDYDVVSGSISFDGKDILELTPDERSLLGLFLAFQYPVEIPGVNTEEFLRMIYNAKRKFQGLNQVDPMEFSSYVENCLDSLNMDQIFLQRSVNHGFSGGEKKKLEMLQMLVLDPSLVVLDETDSGLDIDALRQISSAILSFKTSEKSVLMITHYQRLLEYVKPDYVHVMMDGKIVREGNRTLALELEAKGYDWLEGEGSS